MLSHKFYGLWNIQNDGPNISLSVRLFVTFSENAIKNRSFKNVKEHSYINFVYSYNLQFKVPSLHKYAFIPVCLYCNTLLCHEGLLLLPHLLVDMLLPLVVLVLTT